MLLINKPSMAFSIQFSLISLILISSLAHHSLSHQLVSIEEEEAFVGLRRLLGFKEKAPNSNTTFECSPSGPCIPCQYSEKSDSNYRCSETGYRISFKCTKLGDALNDSSDKKLNSHSTQAGSADTEESAVKHRTLAVNASGQKIESKEYVTYRSCIQGVNEEKLSVIGFEVLILGLLLVSGSFVFVRRRKTQAMAGVGNVRVQSNSSRF